VYIEMDEIGMVVVETATFLRQAKERLAAQEREAVVAYLACHPEAGDLMEGTGGVRKVRWAVQGRGKSGGVRVIYYYHSAQVPLFLLSVFAKNEKANLTAGEKADAKKLVKLLVASYARGGRHD
jgi:hypothetical protein